MSFTLPLTVPQLLTPLTSDQFRAIGVSALQTLGLQPQNWAPGGVASSLLRVGCQLLASLSTQLSEALSDQWNPTATGPGLELLSYYFYGNTPPQPTFASGNLVLTNTGGGIFSYGANQAQFASTVANSEGIFPTYTNETAFTLNPHQTITIPIVCTFVGSAGNAAPGFVTQLITSMLGVTANNPTPILGSDGLSDDDLRQLNLDSIAKNSVFGPRSIYSYAIRTATNIVTGIPVNINRWTITTGSHIGDVTIYICGPDGTTDSNDLLGVAQNIESLARPEGITVGPNTVTIAGNTIGSPAAAAPITYAPSSITVYALAPKGTDAATVQTACLNGLDAFFSSPANPIGGITGSDDTVSNFTGIFESGVSGVLAQAVASIPGCVMLSSKFTGVSDLALTAGQVATNGITSSILTVSLQFQGA